MKKEFTRKDYYAVKHHYLIFDTLLKICRMVGLLLILGLVIYVGAYSSYGSKDVEFATTYNKVAPILRNITIAEVIVWIIIKIIVVSFKKFLRKKKRKLDILDEL